MSRMLLVGVGGKSGITAASLQASLVGYWRDDEASGTAADYSGNANTLTDNNTVTSATGKVNALARLFTRANSESLSRADQASFEVGAQSWSTCGWFYLTTVPTVDRSKLLGKWDGNNNRGYNIEVLLNPNLNLYVQNQDAAQVKVAQHGTTLVAATWYFAAGGWDAVQNKSWVSLNAGARTESTAGSAMAFVDGTYTFRHGAVAFPAASWYLDGRMEQWGLWIGRVLTDAELTFIYNGGAGRQLF